VGLGLGSVSGQSKQVIDELDLGLNSTYFDLSLPHHVHCLVALWCPPSCWEGEKAQSRFHPSFDESVVLLDYVVQVFNRWELALSRQGNRI
jgi:hypothetical protein